MSLSDRIRSWTSSMLDEFNSAVQAHGGDPYDYGAMDDFLKKHPGLAIGYNVLTKLTGRQNRINEYFSDQLAQKDFERSMSAAEQAHKWDVENMQMQQDYESAMANTSYQRGVADMKAAGLNPLLAYSQGGAAVPSVSAVSSSQAQSHPGQVDTHDYLRDMLQFAVQTASIIASLGGSLARTGALEGRSAILAANNTASNSAKLAAATLAANSKDAAERFRWEHDHVSYRQKKNEPLKRSRHRYGHASDSGSGYDYFGAAQWLADHGY